MTRRPAILILALLWAGIYLPGLGSLEIKGEEGRRILPAVTMLEGGSWLVPEVGGKPYLRKPPLMNWAIAGSMKALGRRNEWAARLPSALAVLGLCVVLVAASGPRARTLWTPEVAFVAAALLLVQAGLLAKARFAGAEIEGLYVPLSGVGIALWLIFWEQRRSPWLLWCLPAVFLGLAALTKAPLHLLFYYAIVIAVLFQAREWQALRQPAHFVAILIIGGIFAAWAIPYFQSEAARGAAKVWGDQFGGRVTENKFDLASYLLNIPRGLSDLLPGLLFFPVLWARRNAWRDREGAMIRGTLIATVACFFLLLLIPGVLTRYVLPLGVPMAMLLALAVAEEKFQPPTRALRLWWETNTGIAVLLMTLAVGAPLIAVFGEHLRTAATGQPIESEAALLWWPLLAAAPSFAIAFTLFTRRRHFARPTRLAGASLALCAVAMMLFAAVAIPMLRRGERLRPLARAIDNAVPDHARLFVFDPEYQPALFYLRHPRKEIAAARDLPLDAEYVLARSGNVGSFLKQRPEFQVVRKFSGRDKNQLLLLQRHP